MVKVVLLTVLAGCIFTGVFIGIYSTVPNRYTGTILLQEEGYQNFKYALAEDWVSIRTLQSLDSDEHLVDFDVSVPHSRTFPYGKTYGRVGDQIFVSFLSVIITAALVSLLVVTHNFLTPGEEE